MGKLAIENEGHKEGGAKKIWTKLDQLRAVFDWQLFANPSTLNILKREYHDKLCYTFCKQNEFWKYWKQYHSLLWTANDVNQDHVRTVYTLEWTSAQQAKCWIQDKFQFDIYITDHNSSKKKMEDRESQAG